MYQQQRDGFFYEVVDGMCVGRPLTAEEVPVQTIPDEVKAQIEQAMRENSEVVIKGMAGTVLSMIRTRRDHPTFGATKTTIRAALVKMEGAIGLYMVQHGQATHPNMSVLAEFVWPETETVVREARAAVRGL